MRFLSPRGDQFYEPSIDYLTQGNFSLLFFWMEELIYDIEMGLSRNNASSSGMMVLILSRFKFIFLDHHLLTKKIDSKIKGKSSYYIYITRGGYFFLYLKRQYFLTCGLPFCKGNKHLGYPYRKIGNKQGNLLIRYPNQILHEEYKFTQDIKVQVHPVERQVMTCLDIFLRIQGCSPSYSYICSTWTPLDGEGGLFNQMSDSFKSLLIFLLCIILRPSYQCLISFKIRVQFGLLFDQVYMLRFQLGQELIN